MVNALSADNRFVLWNRECERVTGYSADEIVGNPEALRLLYPDEVYLEGLLREWAARGNEFRDWEMDLTAKDGSVRTVAWSNIAGRVPIPGWAAWAIGVDVTERKRAEEKLRAYRDELRSLASELALAEERERRHIATWLHDTLAQSLALSKIRLGAARAASPSPAIAEALDEATAALDLAIQQARSMTFELGSPILYQVGLEAAVERLAEQFQEKYGIACAFEGDGEPKPLQEETSIILFRAARELLVNVVKHAQATRAEVGMRRDGDAIRITVSDDGVGFDLSDTGLVERRAGGFGLFSIRERLGRWGGTLRVESGRGRGTRATLTAPLGPDRGAGTGEPP
jgi:PAS domain S-box-containing protein